MDLTITGKNLEINDTIRKYVEKKIGRLDRYLPNIIDGRVELTVDEGATRLRTARSPRSRYAPRKSSCAPKRRRPISSPRSTPCSRRCSAR